MRRRETSLSILLPTTLWLVAGCGQDGETDLLGAPPPRAGTVVAESCALDDTQRAALASPAARRVLGTVVLLCLDATAAGDVVTADASGPAALQQQIDLLRADGYRVDLGLRLGEGGASYDAARAGSLLADAGLRSAAIAHLLALPLSFDGLEVALPRLDDSAAPAVLAFVTELGAVVRPAHPLDLFTPPSVVAPSDVPGGNAYDLLMLRASVDRFRLMTLDFSCCGAPPGPTLDAGWAVDAERFAEQSTGAALLDVAVPLYGTDFGGATSHAVTFDEAETLAAQHGVAVAVAIGGARHFDYVDASGASHAVWYDDARSTRRTLAAWTADVMPLSVGVVFYGLGAEDPTLWSALAGTP